MTRKKIIKVISGKSVAPEDLNQEEPDPESSRSEVPDLDPGEITNLPMTDEDDDADLVNAYEIVPKNGDFVVVALPTKKAVKHFVGLIIDDSDERSLKYTIKFMRKTQNRVFIFPTEDDISSTP